MHRTLFALLLLWRMCLRKSGIANNKSARALKSSNMLQGFNFDLEHSMLLTLHHSCLFVSATQLVASDGAEGDQFG